MNREQLYDGLTEIRDDLVKAAEKPLRRKRPGLRALAACLVLLVGLGLVLPNLGGRAGGGGQDGRSYMSYTGPVFPLTTREPAEGLAVVRVTEFDFAPYASPERSYTDGEGNLQTYTSGHPEVLVTDNYTLTNFTDQAVTVTAEYPFAASLHNALRFLPRVTVDGAAAELTLGAGAAMEDTDGSWEDYKALLEDGSYRQAALGGPPQLDQPVVVYELLDYAALGEGTNPTLNFETDIDYGRTMVLSYGMNGGTFDPEGGRFARHFSIPGPEDDTESRCILVLGEDLADYTVQAYADGGCDPGEELETLCRVERYESTLGDMLARFYAEDRGYLSGDEARIQDLASEELYLGLLAGLMEQQGMTDPEAFTGSYWSGEDLTSLFAWNSGGQRVLYAGFTVTIPAGGQAEVSVALHRESHEDFTGKHKGRDGYDMVTALDSTLAFTEQRAALANWELVEILDQNFGFEPDKGITEVVLDPAQAHYWMDVKARK